MFNPPRLFCTATGAVRVPTTPDPERDNDYGKHAGAPALTGSMECICVTELNASRVATVPTFKVRIFFLILAQSPQNANWKRIAGSPTQFPLSRTPKLRSNHELFPHAFM
eukprot:350244-Rhodomonas_salina.5